MQHHIYTNIIYFLYHLVIPIYNIYLYLNSSLHLGTDDAQIRVGYSLTMVSTYLMVNVICDENSRYDLYKHAANSLTRSVTMDPLRYQSSLQDHIQNIDNPGGKYLLGCYEGTYYDYPLPYLFNWVALTMD